MRSIYLWIWVSAVLIQASSPVWAAEQTCDYVVVASKATCDEPGWRAVIDTLLNLHRGSLISYTGAVQTTLSELRVKLPRYVCFVVKPAEVTRSFVASLHRLTRSLNDDPYPDCFWGILTGYDATNALRIAQHQEPLVVHKAAAGTEIPLELFEAGRWYSELKPGLMVSKEFGGKSVTNEVAVDSTKGLVDALTTYGADLFITSGHATERNWQIGFTYRNGYFRCNKGTLYGEDTNGNKFEIISPGPRVYLPIGNCLMGHIDSTNAMALAFMNSAGVLQMLGYTVNTWYGYAGWGCLDYFVEQPGRYTFAQAFLANQIALMHRIQMYFPDVSAAELDRRGRLAGETIISPAARQAGLTAEDATGLVYDRDTLAFYGDPAWSARLASSPSGWEQRLIRDGDQWTFEIVPRRGETSFQPLSLNGSQRGGRPFIQFFDERLKAIEIISGQELNPVVTDTFLLIPNPGRCDISKPYKVVFRGTPVRR